MKAKPTFREYSNKLNTAVVLRGFGTLFLGASLVVLFLSLQSVRSTGGGAKEIFMTWLVFAFIFLGPITLILGGLFLVAAKNCERSAEEMGRELGLGEPSGQTRDLRG